MEKVKVKYLPEIENLINDLSNLLFQREYFSYYEYALNYVDKLTFFIEKEMVDFPHKLSPYPLNKFGTYYAFYKPNNRTTWYIFFEKNKNHYLITHISNNHIKEINLL